MAELVDAPVLGTGTERRVGSNPTESTNKINNYEKILSSWFNVKTLTNYEDKRNFRNDSVFSHVSQSAERSFIPLWWTLQQMWISSWLQS